MKPKDEAQNEILKRIKAGAYADSYLAYNRKSTDDLDIQKNSIRYQRSENLRFAERNNLEIAPLTLEGFCKDGVVSERHSAFKEDFALTFGKDGTVQYRVERPKFHRLAHFLSKGYFKGVIILCWDRGSRNKGDETILRKLMKAGVDIRFVLASYDKSSSGELHMDIDGMFAAHHSRVTREKVSLTIANARARGLWTNKAPVGYLNTGSMEHKPFDPVRAPIIRALFQKATTGQWSLADLARFAIEQGFVMPPVRRRRTEEEVLAEDEDDIRVEIEPVSRPPTFNNIHKILTNRFYTGKVITKHGNWIPSKSHEALVSEELFNDVQERLRRRSTSAHYAEVLEHPLRGMVYCKLCGRVYTPYVKKGTLYFGSRCSPGCSNPKKSFNFAFVAEKVGALIQNLSFSEGELAFLDTNANPEIALLEAKRLAALDSNERRTKKIREDLAYLNANRLTLLKTGAYTPEKLALEEEVLERELTLAGKEKASDVSIPHMIKVSENFSELLKDSMNTYLAAGPHEKDTITRIVFSELTLFENTLEYQCARGFRSLASRLVPNCDPTGWISELYSFRKDIIQATEALSRVLEEIRIARLDSCMDSAPGHTKPDYSDKKASNG